LAVRNTWEGEAAARLEALAGTAADGSARTDPWPEVELGKDASGRPQLPAGRLLAAAAERLARGERPQQVAAGLHGAFCRLARELSRLVLPPGVTAVGLGGGCLVNRLLRRSLAAGLADLGWTPCLPREVPPGDGGLSYGQAVLAAVAGARGAEPLERAG
jgi:hydrogenase maturation protein HypF